MSKPMSRILLASAAAVAICGPGLAVHQWSTYHWNKGTDQLAVPIGNNLSAVWNPYLQDAVGKQGDVAPPGWNYSLAIESPIVAGGTTPRRCSAAAGRIEVCNNTYGGTGWLGIAGISISGGHITSGYTKLNDTYFNTARYNTPAWRRLVICQEIGHNYGLGHTNEIFDNYNNGTCMDYTNAPAGGKIGGFDYGPSNEFQNQHDYDMLSSSAMYGSGHAHTGSVTSFGIREFGKPNPPPAAGFGIEGGNSMADWGRAVKYDGEGRPHIFEQVNGDRKIITHVFWVPGFRPGGSH